MACASSSLTVETYEDATTSTMASGREEPKPLNKRRHSSFHPRRISSEHVMDGEEGLMLKVDIFLSELERRLDFIEKYGNLTFDSSISWSYATLQAVRMRCSQVSGEVLGATKRRARIMVETVESRYQDALAAHETLHEKVHTGIGLLEGILSEFEARAYKVKEKGLRGTAESLMDEGRKIVDEGLEKAREVVDEGFERAKKAAGTVEEHIENAIARAKQHGLIRYEDLPIPWRVNPHIVKGYRFTESKVECIQSMFGLSNETGGVILPWHPTFNRQDMAWARVAFYVSLGATGFVPALELYLTRGGAWSAEFYAPLAKSVTVYLVGAFVLC
ncbi:hypothetical protein DID88_004308 [Monilinia fructigena]|uniref:Uncharacterized protein n=1 Tax=Monilinia fructigena TaxID=38457 RepID=A0A395ISE2_9HELO|nr:hypothetical protein DID88_004308 [Monilinia fructigena]